MTMEMFKQNKYDQEKFHAEVIRERKLMLEKSKQEKREHSLIKWDQYRAEKINRVQEYVKVLKE